MSCAAFPWTYLYFVSNSRMRAGKTGGGEKVNRGLMNIYIIHLFLFISEICSWFTD